MDLYEKGDTEEDVFSRLDHTDQEYMIISSFAWQTRLTPRNRDQAQKLLSIVM